MATNEFTQNISPKPEMYPGFFSNPKAQRFVQENVTKEEQEVYIPTMKDILSGTVTSIGDEPISPLLVEGLKKGNAESELEINRLLDKVESQKLRTESGPAIAGTSRTATGGLQAIPEQDLIEQYKLDPASAGQVFKYAETAISLDEVATKHSLDPILRQALADVFDRSTTKTKLYRENITDFYKRFFANGEKIARRAEFSARALGSAVRDEFDRIVDINEDVDIFGRGGLWNQKWEEIYRPAMLDELSRNRLFDPRSTEARQEIEEILKNHIVSNYDDGEKIWNELSTVTFPDGRRVPVDVLSVSAGRDIYKWTEDSLTAGELVMDIASDTVPMTVGIEGAGRAMSALKMRKIKKFIEDNPGSKYDWARGTNYPQIYRQIQDDTKVNIAQRAFRKTGRLIVDGFGFKPFLFTGDLGRRQSKADFAKSLELSNQAVKDASANLSAALNGTDAQKIKDAKAALAAVTRRNSQLSFVDKLGGDPYYLSLAKDESIMVLSQAGFESYFDSELGGAVGGILGLIGGNFAGKKITNVLSGETSAGLDRTRPSNQLRRLVRAAESVGEKFFNLDEGRLGLLTGGRYDELAAVMGKDLSASEIQGFQVLASMFRGIPEKDRPANFRNLKQAYRARENLIEGIEDPELRTNVGKDLTILAGEAANVNFIRAFQLENAPKITDVSSLGEAFVIQQQLERETIAATATLAALKENLQMIPGGANKKISNFVANTEAMLQDMDKVMLATNENLQRYVETLPEILSNPAQGIDAPQLFNDILKITKVTSDSSVGRTTMDAATRLQVEQQVLDTALNRTLDILNKRVTNLNEMKGLAGTRENLFVALEAQTIAIQKHRKALGKEAYRPVDEIAKDNTVNMLPLVYKFMDNTEGMNRRSLKGFYTGERAALAKGAGREFQSIMQDMSERNLKNLLEVDSSEEIMALVSVPKIRIDGVEQDNPFFVNDPDVLKEGLADIGLFLANKDEKFAETLFQASVFEADSMRSVFSYQGNAAANSLRPDRAKSASLLFDIADSVDEQIRGIPGIAEKLDEARKVYKGEVFDMERTITGTRIARARSGNAEVTYRDVYGFEYKEGMSPADWTASTVNLIGDSIISGTPNKEHIMNSVHEMIRFYGGSRIAKEGDVEGFDFVFDLRDEKAVERLKTIKNAIESGVNIKYGEELAEDVIKAKTGLEAKRNIAAGAIGKGSGMGVGSIKDVEDAILSQVKVIDAETGQVRQATRAEFINLEKTISDANTFEEALTASNTLKAAYTSAENAIAAESKRILTSGDLAIKQAAETNIMNLAQMSKLGRSANPQMDFFEKVALNKDATLIKSMKETYIANGGNAADFEDVAGELLVEGFLDHIGKAAAPSTFDKGYIASQSTVSNPEIGRELLASEDFRNILREAGIKDERLDTLEDTIILLQTISSTGAISGSIGGAVRNISPNEIISRSFNIARRMVSPTYVAAEMAFRIMQKNKIDVLRFAASSEQAGEILYKMLSNPDAITPTDMNTFSTLAKAYVATSMARNRVGPEGVAEEDIPVYYRGEEDEQGNFPNN